MLIDSDKVDARLKEQITNFCFWQTCSVNENIQASPTIFKRRSFVRKFCLFEGTVLMNTEKTDSMINRAN